MGSSPSTQSKKFTSITPSASLPDSSQSSSDGCLSDQARLMTRPPLLRSTTFFVQPYADMPRASLPSIKLDPIDADKLKKVRSSGKKSRSASERLRKRQELPPLEIRPDVTTTTMNNNDKLLPFNEYKRWLSNLRNNSVKLTPVKPLKEVRCKTATLRIRRKRKPSAKPASPNARIFTVTNGTGRNLNPQVEQQPDLRKSVFFTTGYEESCGIFDLKALNDALTKPRNKVVPMPHGRKKIAAAIH